MLRKICAKNATGLFNVLKEKFRPQYKKTILLLQYSKLHREDNGSTQEWMGRLWIRATIFNYKEHDGMLKEQFINSIDNKEIMQEIIKELMIQKNT